jgi:L-asparaginase
MSRYTHHILLIFTGGTIGSVDSNGHINTDERARFTLLQKFEQRDISPFNVHFTTRQALNLLSENLAPQAWEVLIKVIETELLLAEHSFDGIIITHGTDTLSFSAAVLGLYFHAINYPMLLVSSNYPLDDARANGVDNFYCAVDVICQATLTGVFVPYQNPQQAMVLHAGTHLLSCLPLSSDFISLQQRHVMTYAERKFTDYHPLPALSRKSFSLNPCFSARILVLHPYPGMNYQAINIANVDCVLHNLYHSGTACVAKQWGEQLSLLTFIEHCKTQCVPVYLAPMLQSSASYESTHELIAQGAEIIWNVSLETAYAKLALAYSNFSQATLMDFINADIAGEHVLTES